MSERKPEFRQRHPKLRLEFWIQRSGQLWDAEWEFQHWHTDYSEQSEHGLHKSVFDWQFWAGRWDSHRKYWNQFRDAEWRRSDEPRITGTYNVRASQGDNSDSGCDTSDTGHNRKANNSTCWKEWHYQDLWWGKQKYRNCSP